MSTLLPKALLRRDSSVSLSSTITGRPQARNGRSLDLEREFFSPSRNSSEQVSTTIIFSILAPLTLMVPFPGSAWRSMTLEFQRGVEAKWRAQHSFAATAHPARCGNGYPEPSTLGSKIAVAGGSFSPGIWWSRMITSTPFIISSLISSRAEMPLSTVITREYPPSSISFTPSFVIP